MKIDFFSARKLQHSYFIQLQNALISQGHQSDILWHKTLWLYSFWVKYLHRAPKALTDICDNARQEKQNAKKHQNKKCAYWLIFRAIKTFESHLLFAIYYGALKKSGADVVIVWNGLKYRQSIAVCAAKALNIRCLFVENGLIPNSTTIDPCGINYFNAIPRDPQFFIAQNCPPFAFTPTDNLDTALAAPPYIFVPFQVNTDTQITLFSPWIKDTTALLNVFIAASQALGEAMPLVYFKAHPQGDENIPALQALINDDPKLKIIEDLDTATLLDNASSIITINSTVGIESLLKKKSVMVLGQAFYGIDELTLQANNQAQLNQQLPLINGFKPNDKLINNFLSYLSHDYQIKTSWKAVDQEHIALMTKRIIQLSQHAT